jgi:hypothetical protein
MQQFIPALFQNIFAAHLIIQPLIIKQFKDEKIFSVIPWS